MSEEQYMIEIRREGYLPEFLARPWKAGKNLGLTHRLEYAYTASWITINATARTVERIRPDCKTVVIAERDARALKAS